MSTFVDQLRSRLAAQGAQALQDHGEEWLDKALSAAHKLLPEEQPGRLGEGGVYRLTAGLALRAIESHKGELARLGPDGLALALTLLGQERLDEAALVFLRDVAGWGALHEASQGMREETIAGKHEREARKAAALAILRAIGGAAARTALPVLLSVLPIPALKL